MTKQELQKAIHENYPIRMFIGPYAVDTVGSISDVSERIEKGASKSLVTISISFAADRLPGEVADERKQDALRRKNFGYFPFRWED